MTTSRALLRAAALALLAAAALGAEGYSASGLASWYGSDFQGRRTASGESFDKEKYSAAHRSLPFGTLLLVTLESTGKRVVVRVNDRGPFVEGRIIDLSEAAARAIGLDAAGIGRVALSELSDFPVGPLPGAAAGTGSAVVAGKAPPSPSIQPSPRPSALCDIQVASFSAKENADRAAARLTAAGYSPQIRFEAGHYRVVLAGLPAEGAETERRRLDDLGFPRVLVTVRQIAKDR